ncbi:MAG: VCBS repeat-containing protein [Nitrospirae bacterium]|nr:VCBS repeat-containing protein [Nitrospirota bacterium]
MELSPAADKNGVSPNTISLPKGPGSIEGLGESFQPMLNTGTARYAVKIAMPPGVAGNTPELTLQYDSGLGDGPAGIGWAYGPGSISRQIDKGLPRYVDGTNRLDDDADNIIDEADEIDTFVGPDGEELVKLADGTYRARIEGHFTRYRKLNDRWEADLVNGAVLTFGSAQTARVSDSAGTKIYRWLLEKSRDENGNVIEYSYATFPGSDNQKYLKEIRYGPGASPWSVFYFVSFTYEDRQDWRKDYRSGFLVKTSKRLAAVNIGIQGLQPEQCAPGNWNNDYTADALIRRYTLTYDDAASRISHLSKITLYGSDSFNYLPPISFRYSTYVPPMSVSAKEVIINSGNVPGTVMDNELVDLIDLNRDGLPDILKTDFYGNSHTAYRNLGIEIKGNKKTIIWDNAKIMQSVDMLALPLHLAKDRVSLADMNGDGISDLVNVPITNEVFYYPNKGDFSWGARQPMSIQDTAPPAPFVLNAVKSTDIDFNKRMDIVMSTENGYAVWLNYEDGKYSREVRTSGAVWNGRVMLFSDTGFDFADINGDRLSDAVRITPAKVVYCASMGYGIFADAVEISIPDTVLTEEQIKRAKLSDVNGDGLDDLVVERAQANELWFWLNRGTDSFSEKYTVTNMPTQFGQNTAVRWADLNGNGTTDLIYADSSTTDKLRMIDIGELVSGSAYPNLLTEIDNGLGVVTSIKYKSSTEYYLAAAAEGKPWTSTVPFPVQTVSGVTTTTGLDLDDVSGNDEYRKDFVYRDGYYEDREKQFRGFSQVVVTEYGDATAPTKVSQHEFFTGGPDGADNDGDGFVDEVTKELHREEDALKGMVQAVEQRAVNGAVFSRDENSYLVRNLLVSPDGIEVRFAYNTQTDKLIYEGKTTPETMRSTYLYDDFGNVTEEKNYGALSITGDEAFSATEYINDTTLWILKVPKRQLITDKDGKKYAETLSYYDGADFVGLSLGQLTKGQLTRKTGWVSGSNYIDLIRNSYDVYGNITAILDPNGNRRRLTYDTVLRAFPLREDIEVGGGKPDLSIIAAYNMGLGTIFSSLDFNGNQINYKNDVFGRLTSIIKPGDTLQYPTQTFAYEMSDPQKGLLYSYDADGNLSLSQTPARPSAVRTSAREVSGQSATYDVIQYVDSIGRKLALVEEGEQGFIVKEAALFNAMGTPRFAFLPYESATNGYSRPNVNGSKVETVYDAAGRAVKVINPPDTDGVVTSSSMLYEPLRVTATDENGNKKTTITDGPGRLVEVRENNLGETYITGYSYDTSGNLIKIMDAQNNIKTLQYDGLKRKVSMDDPDKGHMEYEYDNAGNLIRTVDNKGQVIQYTYDGANRQLTEDFLDAANISPDASFYYDAPSPDYPAAENTKGALAYVRDLSGGKFISYDKRGNITWAVNRIVDNGKTTDFRTGNEYDAMGRTTAVIYPDGDMVTYSYNNGSLLESIPGFVQYIDYHVSGAVETMSYANNITTSYEFDPRYRLKRLITAPQTGNAIQDLSYGFDKVSNIKTITDMRQIAANSPANATQTFQYDDLYRLTRSEGTGYGAITYQYDRIGNMTYQKSPDAPDPKYINDPLINLGAMTYGGAAGRSNRGAKLPGNAPGPHAITGTASGLVYDYDDSGNMTRHTNGDIYEWDFGDRLVKVSTSSGTVNSYVYDSGGTRVIKKVLENGIEKTSYYVTDGYEIRDGKAEKYVFDGTRRIARVEGKLSPGGAGSQVLRLVPGWNFISLEVEPGNPAVSSVLSSIAGKYSDVWTWDAATQAYIGFVPGGGINSLTELHAQQGYIIRMTEPATLIISGTTTSNNVILKSGWNLISCPADREMPVTEALSLMTGQVEALWEYDTRSGSWEDYLPGQPALLNNLKTLSPGKAYWIKTTAEGQATFSRTPLSIQYFHPDHLGSSSLVTDSSGAVVERSEFYPYGRPRYEEHNNFDSAYKFTGKELDKESGLMYFEARYYDAVVGRFVSVDPMEDKDNEIPGKLNPFSYAQNNPLNMIDPSGLDEFGFGENFWAFAKGVGKGAVATLISPYYLAQGLGYSAGMAYIAIAGTKRESDQIVENAIDLHSLPKRIATGIAQADPRNLSEGLGMIYGAPVGGVLAAKALKITQSMANYVKVRSFVNKFETTSDIVVHNSKGMSARLMADITKKTGKEVALLRIDGKRVLRIGEPGEVSAKGAQRIIAHTHPKGSLRFSHKYEYDPKTRELTQYGDVPVLRNLGQRSSLIITPNGRTARPRVPYY